MATGSTKIGNSLAIKPQNTEPASAVECDIYNNLGELFIKRGDDFIPLGRSNEIPGNFAYSWGDCERSFNSETRSALTDTTSRTDSYWAYLSTGAAPSQETSSPLIGGASIKCVLDTSGEFLETRLFQVPTGYLGKPINFSFLMNTSTMTATTDYTVQIIRYDLNFEYKETISCVYNRFLGTGTLSGFFIAGNTGTDWYSLAISMNATVASCEPIFDSFYFGVNQVSMSSGVDEIRNYTPTSNITNCTHTGQIIVRNGTGKISINLQMTGTPASVTFTFTKAGLMNGLPYALDATNDILLKGSDDTYKIVGAWKFLDAGNDHYYGGNIGYSPLRDSFILFYLNNVNNTQAAVTQAAPVTWANGDIITLDFHHTFLITNASSGITLLSNDNVKSVVRAKIGATPQTVTSLEAIIFDVNSKDVKGEYDIATGKFTAKTAGTFRFVANLVVSVTSAPNCIYFYYKIGAGSTQYGEYYEDAITANKYKTVIVETILDLNAGEYVILYGDAPTNNMLIHGSATHNTSFLIIEQLTLKDSLMGMPISTQNVVGRTDGTIPASGFIGEIKGTAQTGGTGGNTYYSKVIGSGATLFSTSGVAGATVTLNKGLYLASFSGYAVKAANTNVDRTYFYPSIGGTTSGSGFSSGSINISGGLMTVNNTIPIMITSDNTAVTYTGYTLTDTCTACESYISATRIA